MTYTTSSVKVAKTGIQIGYIDDQGVSSTQNLNFDNKTLTLDSGLTISAGNASMAGDLAVSGGVNMGGVAHIEGAATMASTVDVTGATHLHNTLLVDGASHLGSSLLVDGASHLVGALTQDGAASFGSTVSVSGAASMGSTLDVTGASHLASTLLVDGASHLVGALTQDGAASFGSSLDVSGASHLASTLLVDGASTMGSTLVVAGASTFNSDHTVNGTSAVNGAMTVSGATAIGGAVNVTGATNLGSTLDVAGATYFASTAEVSGTTHLVGAVTADDALSVGTTLDVTGASHLASTLLVDGASHLVGAVTADAAVSMGSTLAVTGAASFSSTVSATGATSLGSTLDVTGASHLASTLLVDGTSHLVGAVTADAAVSMGSTLGVTGATDLASTLDVAGATDLASTLDVTGASHLKSTVQADGAVSMGSTLDVSGVASFDSAINVSGNATFQSNMTVNGNLTVMGQQTSISTVSMEIKDNAILLAEGNADDTIESGMMLQYKPSGSANVKYAGMKRIPATGEFVFFKDATQKIAEPVEEKSSGAPGPQTTALLGEWVTYDFGTAVQVASYGLGPYSASITIHKWAMAGSNDGVTFHLLDQRDTPNTASYSVINYPLPSPITAYRYIRFIIQSYQSTDGWFFRFGINMRRPDNSFIPYNTATVSPLWRGAEPWGDSGYVLGLNTTDNVGSVGPGLQGAYERVAEGTALYSGVNYAYVGTAQTDILVESSPPAAPAADVYAVVVADSFTSASDARLKKDVVELDSALEKLDQLRGVYYHWIDDNQPKERQVGVIAQEVESVFPELVHNGIAHKSVDYAKLTAVLIQAVKELKAEVAALKSEKQ